SDSRLRNPQRALAMAETMIALEPRQPAYWNTLGVTQYRCGAWQAAADSLLKSMLGGRGGDSSDWFFLAMIQWQLNDQMGARTWYDRAVAWMDQNKPDDEELRRFRAEAAELLGVKTAQPENSPEPTGQKHN